MPSRTPSLITILSPQPFSPETETSKEESIPTLELTTWLLLLLSLLTPLPVPSTTTSKPNLLVKIKMERMFSFQISGPLVMKSVKLLKEASNLRCSLMFTTTFLRDPRCGKTSRPLKVNSTLGMMTPPTSTTLLSSSPPKLRSRKSLMSTTLTAF